MEFFSRELREPDEQLLETMRVIGSQVGQFVARRQAEAEVRASESRLRAMLESALDAVVTMDARGRVARLEPRGRDDLRLPRARGDRPRHGRPDRPAGACAPRIARGSPASSRPSSAVILDRRLELTAMHKNGTEFPVELTITRIGAARAADLHRLPARHHRPQARRRRAARIARAARRGRRRRAAADPAQPPRRRAAAAHRRCCSRSAGCASTAGRDRSCSTFAIDELAAGLRGDPRAGERAASVRPRPSAGSRAALEALALRTPLPVELPRCPTDRLPEPIEAAAYYVVAEALANVQKHAGACRSSCAPRPSDEPLVVEVIDDGAAAPTSEGAGLRGLVDRVEALGGTARARQPDGAGTRLLAELPL